MEREDVSRFPYNELGEWEIRLLRLDMAEDDSSPISGVIITFRHPCHMEIKWKNYRKMASSWHDIRLTEKRGDQYGYDALSYTWGEGTDLQRVFLRRTGKFYHKNVLYSDEKKLGSGAVDIHRNLHALLVQLRRDNYTRFIWIDSICIDQENVQEKNTQLPLMRHIYKEVKNMFVWLGEGTAAEEYALMMLPNLTKLLENITYTEAIALDAESPQTFAAVGLPEPSHPVWQGLGSLMSRPWFRRLWTLQEVVLPPKDAITILCGRKRIPWFQLSEFSHEVSERFQRVIGNRTITGHSQIHSEQLTAYDAIRTVACCRTALDDNGFGLSLTILLPASHLREATYAADKVLGLMGMAPCGLVEHLDLDVSMPVHEVFLRFSSYYVRHELDECLLNLSGSHERLPGLPSWCLNLASPPTVASIGTRWHMNYRHGDTTNAKRYCAGFSREGEWAVPLSNRMVRQMVSNLVHQFPIGHGFHDSSDPRQISIASNPRQLLVSGTIIDEVAEIVKRDSIVKTFETSFQNIIEMAKWEENCLQLAKGTCQWTESVLDQYCRTLAANQPGTQYNEEVMIWDSEHKIDMLAHYLKWKEYLAASLKEGTVLSQADYMILQARQYCWQVIKLAKNRCFFTTRGGRFGLGPPDMKAGDKLCVIIFCPTPYILRPTGSTYEFIGETYVHGLMYGEALGMLDRGELTETRFTLE